MLRLYTRRKTKGESGIFLFVRGGGLQRKTKQKLVYVHFRYVFVSRTKFLGGEGAQNRYPLDTALPKAFPNVLDSLLLNAEDILWYTGVKFIQLLFFFSTGRGPIVVTDSLFFFFFCHFRPVRL